MGLIVRSTGHHVTPLLHGTPTGQDVAVKCHCWWVMLQCCRTRIWWKDKPATTGLTSARQPDATSLQTSSLKVAAIWITSLPSASQRSTRLILCREVTLLSEPCPPLYYCPLLPPGHLTVLSCSLAHSSWWSLSGAGLTMRRPSRQQSIAA